MIDVNIQHAEMVKVWCKTGEQIKKELTPHGARLMHMVFGISGEAGELLDAIKKKIIYCQTLDINNIIEELGDIEFYLEGLRQDLAISRQQCLEANINKLAKRYKDFKYTDQRAKERADKNENII